MSYYFSKMLALGLDLPENAVALIVEAAKVVFSVRVIVRREAVERRHTLGNFNYRNQAKITKAACHNLLAKADACRIAAAGRLAEAVMR